MHRFHGIFALGLFLGAVSTAAAQVTGGVMSVSQSHMS
jgi:hypothetical protein